MTEERLVHEEPLPEGEEETPRGVRAAAVVRWAIVAAVGLAAVGTVGSAVFADSESAAHGKHRYHCPMHPQVVSDSPGTCPICGMDLVPIEESHAPMKSTSSVPGMQEVMLAADRIQTSGIRTAKALRKSLHPTIRAVGFVGADERNLAEVTARVPGWLRAAKVVAVGDPVRRGTSLGTIESPDALALTRELVAVRALGGAPGLGASDLASPVRQRLELLGLPPEAIARVEKTARPIRFLPVVAPIAGTVTARAAVPGTYVERGAPLYSIADLSTVWVQAEVYARDLSRVTAGQRASVAFEGSAAPAAEGTVAHVYPTTEEATRTTRVRIELPNPDLRVRPGLFADVEIRGAPVEGVFVPAEAVVETGDRRYVFAVHGGGRFEPRAVRTGPRVGDEVVVLEGVGDGEEVVGSGTFVLDSESRIRAAISGASAHAGHGAP